MANPQVDVNADLLDRQVVDSAGVGICKVDDVVFVRGEDGRWRVDGILVGPGALGPRIGGRVGAVLTGLNRRRHSSPVGIPWRYVVRMTSDVRLSVPREALADLDPLEGWLRRHVIDHLPGSRHASG